MSARAADDDIVNLTITLRDALIALGKLTPESAERVDDVMRTMGLGFGDAAVRLGLIMPEEIEEAILAARQLPPKTSDGIVEDALQRRSSNRNLPVKYVRMVKPGPSLVLAHHADNTYSEQIRALRTELQLLNGPTPSGILIAILSPCQGEGRTQLCAELAVAFSHLGRRTLLVDADLRRPRIHALFESINSPGLGQALAIGGVPELLGVEGLPHLSVLMAGPNVLNPLELLTSGDFQSHLTDLRKQFSIIIIDTPPITEFADGLAIASFADQVVIVGRLGSTPHKNTKEMLRRMGGIQARIVGAVINSF